VPVMTQQQSTLLLFCYPVHIINPKENKLKKTIKLIKKIRLNDEIKKETKLKKQCQSTLTFQTHNLGSLDRKHHV